MFKASNLRKNLLGATLLLLLMGLAYVFLFTARYEMLNNSGSRLLSHYAETMTKELKNFQTRFYAKDFKGLESFAEVEFSLPEKRKAEFERLQTALRTNLYAFAEGKMTTKQVERELRFILFDAQELRDQLYQDASLQNRAKELQRNQLKQDFMKVFFVLFSLLFILALLSFFSVKSGEKEVFSQLYQATEELRQGNFEFLIDLEGLPEGKTAQLYRNINFMSRRLAVMRGRLEENNQLLFEKAESLDEIAKHKSKFIREIGHELRAPLSSVIGFSNLLLEEAYGELTIKQEETIERMERNAGNILELLNDLVEQSKMEAGTLELKRERIELKNFIVELMASQEGQVLEAGLKSQIEISKAVSISVDSLRLRQIFLNLLSNAIKFTPKGGELFWSLEESPENVSISLRDTGIGMTKEEITQVFTEFHQLDTQHKSEGAGLGLALCRQLARLHGGDILLESEAGEGSIFTLVLPR